MRIFLDKILIRVVLMNRVKLSRVSPRIGGRVGSGKSTPGWKAVMVVIVDYAGDSTKDA